MKVITKNLEETYKLARELALDLSKQACLPARQGATVVGLYGDLGSGKTSFTQGFAKALGIKETLTSPTFVILKRYENLIHIDAYRLESSDDLKVLGWEDYIKNPDNIILIEWADKVADILPKDHIKINFEYIDENKREITVGSLNSSS